MFQNGALRTVVEECASEMDRHAPGTESFLHPDGSYMDMDLECYIMKKFPSLPVESVIYAVARFWSPKERHHADRP